MSIIEPVVKRWLLKPLHDFLRLEAASGLLLMAAAMLALIVANSSLAAGYTALLDVPFGVRLGTAAIAKPISLWVNDGLMAVFFLLVGLELKREIVEGHLSSLRQASLPAIAAVGGMFAPALVYAAFNRGDAAAMRGWAIPAATDIAFALGVLSLLGKRVPTALKAFLLSVAIFDDLGAIVIIALFYTSELSTVALAVAAALVLLLAILNALGVRRTSAFVLVGIALWVAVLKSGVHATLAGVVLGLFIPLRASRAVTADAPLETPAQSPPESPLTVLEHALHPWVAYGVIPVFAFVNAGVPLGGVALRDALHPVPLGIVGGLLLGKQVGIMAFCWLAVRLRVAALPDEVGWRALHGGALLCGIGFTMSLFIASLAFEQGADLAYQGLERLGILIGTVASGLAGFLVLRTVFRAPDPAA